MRILIITIFLYCLPVILNSQNVDLIDYYPSDGNTGAWDIAQFANGDYLVLGFFQDDITIGGQLISHTDNIDFFISKYSSSDQLLWVNEYGGSGIQRAQDIVIDEEGNFFLAVGFTELLEIEGDTIYSEGQADIAIAKFNNDGQHLWTKSFGSEESDFCYGLYFDDNQLWATGHFSGTMNTGGVTLTSNGSFDQFVMKINAMSGATIWAEGYGGEGLDRLYDLHPASDGSLWVVGYYSDSWEFGSTTLPPATNIDGFAGKIDANGQPEIAIPFACTGPSGQIRYLEIDENDQVYLSGFMSGTYTLFGETYVAGNQTNNEGVLMAVDQFGNLNWLKHTISDYASAGSGVYYLEGRLFHTFYGGESVDLYEDVSFQGGGATDCAFLELNPTDGTVLNLNHMPNMGSAYITTLDGDLNLMRAIVIFKESLELPTQVVGSSMTDDLAIIAYYPEGSNSITEIESLDRQVSMVYDAGVLHFWGLDGVDITSASVFSMKGQLLKTGTITAHQWMVGNMPAGAYLVQIETTEGIISQLFQVLK